jgi:ribonuclease P protein component
VLPAAVRMRASADFSDTVAHGARSSAGPLVVHLRPAAAAAEPSSLRVGLVVSRAVGNAVVRHRVSRRLRHLLAERLPVLPAGSRVVVRALPAAADTATGALATALDRAIARATASNSTAGDKSRPTGKR